MTVVNRDQWHAIRVRNYERDLSSVRVALDEVLEPIGVERVRGRGRRHRFRQPAGHLLRGRRTSIDLPMTGWSSPSAAGSSAPTFPGSANLPSMSILTTAPRGSIPTSRASRRSRARPGNIPRSSLAPGLTGIEAATELLGKLRSAGAVAPRVILADHQPRVGSDMGDGACHVIDEALASLGVATRTGVAISAIDRSGATLSTGEKIPAATIVWCAGMRANPLTELFPVRRDRFGRVPVDHFMRVEGMPDTFAAGDAAYAVVDDRHNSVMSCQHARPMGRFAGHNVVCDLMGRPMLPLRIDWYTTILDLGPWGAVYTEGWDRRVVATGAAAKRTKQLINCKRIYPPRSGDRRQILDAAAPVVQRPPPQFHT